MNEDAHSLTVSALNLPQSAVWFAASVILHPHFAIAIAINVIAIAFCICVSLRICHYMICSLSNHMFVSQQFK